jgi:hypothetical protein
MISPRGQIPAIFSHVIVNGSIWGTIALRTKVSARDAIFARAERFADPGA